MFSTIVFAKPEIALQKIDKNTYLYFVSISDDIDKWELLHSDGITDKRLGESKAKPKELFKRGLLITDGASLLVLSYTIKGEKKMIFKEIGKIPNLNDSSLSQFIGVGIGFLLSTLTLVIGGYLKNKAQVRIASNRLISSLNLIIYSWGYCDRDDVELPPALNIMSIYDGLNGVVYCSKLEDRIIEINKLFERWKRQKEQDQDIQVIKRLLNDIRTKKLIRASLL